MLKLAQKGMTRWHFHSPLERGDRRSGCVFIIYADDFSGAISSCPLYPRPKAWDAVFIWARTIK